MFETARYEGERRVRGAGAFALVLGLVSAVFVGLFPSFEDAGADEIADSFPPVFQELFGIEAMGTIEGFLAAEIYSFVWVLLVGLYVAYAAAGLITRDVERGRMDLLLSYPVSRRGVLFEKVAALGVPIVVLNVVVPVFVYGAVLLVGESIDPVRLVMVHALSIPFFLACAGIGVVLSVAFDRVGRAQVTALGLVVLLWLIDGLSYMEPDFEWIGDGTPSRYYDPTAVLVHREYAFLDASALLAAFLVLLIIAAAIFSRRDI